MLYFFDFFCGGVHLGEEFFCADSEASASEHDKLLLHIRTDNPDGMLARHIVRRPFEYNRQGAKWPGAEPDNKKAENLFQDLLLSLAASVAAGIQFL